MKKKKNYYQKYQRYYIGQTLLLIGWVTNSILFFRFYKEAIFYVDKNSKFIIQLLFIVQYYLSDVQTYLFSAFLLMTLNLFLLLMFYTKNRHEVIHQKEMTNSIVVFLMIIGMGAITQLMTIIWPLFLLIFIVSFTIIYIIYVITKSLHEEIDESYDENEVVTIEGPFQTKEAAEEYIIGFSKHWKEHFNKKGLNLVESTKCDEKDEWYVEIIVQSIQ